MHLGSQPLSLNPENPHYFLFRGKPLVIVSSGEHYGSVLNPGFDYLKYLNSMKSEGMCYTRVFSGSYFEKEGSFGIEKNTLAPAKGMALTPWARSNQPGAICGGNMFDLDRWNDEYFKRLKTFMMEASARDIIVEMTLFTSIYSYWDIQPWNIKNNITFRNEISQKDLQTLNNGEAMKYQEALVRKLVRELNEFDNLFYEIQNEPWADHTVRIEPNSEFRNNADFTLDGHEWQKSIEITGEASLDWQKRIGAIIADEEKSLPKKHLIAQNYSNFYYEVPEVDNNVSILNFHYAYPLAVEKNYKHNRVVGFDESGFAGSADATYRKQAWKFIIAGGGLFNNLDYSFAVGSEDGTAINKAPGGGSTALRKQLKVLSDFIHSFDFARMKPAGNIASVPEGSFARVLAEEGKQYAVYLTGRGATRLSLKLPAGRYSSDWINPVDGRMLGTSFSDHKGGEMKLEIPDRDDDIALRIRMTK